MDVSTYQVIARRWRPKNFQELVGQEHIVRTLTNAINQERIAHAYLFVGPRGTGKTSTARLFAMALNAEGGPSVEFDINSPTSQSILKGSSMDVIEIDGASNNSVDQIRELREACIYAPSQCRFKIYIIDEVHMLSTAAFNALLKTLEEPPTHVKFFFATTEAQKVLPTIVSRCQRFEFRPISPEVIAEKLSAIAASEGITVEKSVLITIGRLAGGGMRDAQSILDQIISFCGKKILEEDVLNVYGLASEATVQSLTEALARGNHKTIIQTTAQLVDEGRDLYRVLQNIQDKVHKALLDAIKHQGKTTRLSKEHPLSTESLMQMLEVLQAGEQFLKQGLSERVNFEITLLKALEQGRARSLDALIKEISQLTNQLPPEADKKKISEALEESYDEEPPTPKLLLIDQRERPEESALAKPEKKSPATPLEKAIKTIPVSTRTLLEDLFRAQFKKISPYASSDWF